MAELLFGKDELFGCEKKISFREWLGKHRNERKNCTAFITKTRIWSLPRNGQENRNAGIMGKLRTSPEYTVSMASGHGGRGLTVCLSDTHILVL